MHEIMVTFNLFSGKVSLIIGGGTYIFMFTNLKNNGFQKKFMMQKLNTVYEYMPPPQLSSWLHHCFDTCTLIYNVYITCTSNFDKSDSIIL